MGMLDLFPIMRDGNVLILPDMSGRALRPCGSSGYGRWRLHNRSQMTSTRSSLGDPEKACLTADKREFCALV